MAPPLISVPDREGRSQSSACSSGFAGHGIPPAIPIITMERTLGKCSSRRAARVDATSFADCLWPTAGQFTGTSLCAQLSDRAGGLPPRNSSRSVREERMSGATRVQSPLHTHSSDSRSRALGTAIGQSAPAAASVVMDNRYYPVSMCRLGVLSINSRVTHLVAFMAFIVDNPLPHPRIR